MTADSWTGPDKAKHLLACGVIAFFVAGTVHVLAEIVPSANGHNLATVLGGSAGVIAGLVKESMDAIRTGGSGWSWKDAAADVVGTVLGVAAAWLVAGGAL